MTDSMPWYEDYKRIAAKTYIVDVYDCSNKSEDLAFLWKSPTIILSVPEGLHMVVWIKPYLIDPTYKRIVFCHTLGQIPAVTKRLNWGKVISIQIREYY